MKIYIGNDVTLEYIVEDKDGILIPLTSIVSATASFKLSSQTEKSTCTSTSINNTGCNNDCGATIPGIVNITKDYLTIDVPAKYQSVIGVYDLSVVLKCTNETDSSKITQYTAVILNAIELVPLDVYDKNIVLRGFKGGATLRTDTVEEQLVVITDLFSDIADVSTKEDKVLTQSEISKFSVLRSFINQNKALFIKRKVETNTIIVPLTIRIDHNGDTILTFTSYDANGFVECLNVTIRSDYYVTAVSNNSTYFEYSTIVALAEIQNTISNLSYTKLSNKPTINGVVLDGNKTTTDLNIQTSTTYTDLTDKPQINGVTLSGNKTAAQLGINPTTAYTGLTNKPSINGVTLDGNKTSADLNIQLSSDELDVLIRDYGVSCIQYTKNNYFNIPSGYNIWPGFVTWPGGYGMHSDKIFIIYNTGRLAVLDYKTKALIGTCNLGSNNNDNHANNLNFGSKSYSSNPIPAAYISEAYRASGSYVSRCFVEDITITGSVVKSTLKQTISYTGNMYTNNTSKAIDFIVDAENNFLYVWGGLDNNRYSTKRILKFALPDISASIVTLTDAMILSQFDVYIPGQIQGSCVKDGLLYLGFGASTEPNANLLDRDRVYIVDPKAAAVQSIIKANNRTPETPTRLLEVQGFAWYNDKLYINYHVPADNSVKDRGWIWEYDLVLKNYDDTSIKSAINDVELRDNKVYNSTYSGGVYTVTDPIDLSKGGKFTVFFPSFNPVASPKLNINGVDYPMKTNGKLLDYGQIQAQEISDVWVTGGEARLYGDDVDRASDSETLGLISDTTYMTPKRVGMVLDAHNNSVSAHDKLYEKIKAYITASTKTTENIPIYFNPTSLSFTRPTGTGSDITIAATTTEQVFFDHSLIIGRNGQVSPNNLYWLKLYFKSVSSSRVTYMRIQYFVNNVEIVNEINTLNNSVSDFEFGDFILMNKINEALSYVETDYLRVVLSFWVSNGTDTLYMVTGNKDNISALVRLEPTSAVSAMSYIDNQTVSEINDTTGVLESNKIYRINITDNIKFTLPTEVDNTVFNQIMVQVVVTGTPTIDWGTSVFFNGEQPMITPGKYNIYYEHDGTDWVCGTMIKG